MIHKENTQRKHIPNKNEKKLRTDNRNVIIKN